MLIIIGVTKLKSLATTVIDDNIKHAIKINLNLLLINNYGNKKKKKKMNIFIINNASILFTVKDNILK